ncbi:sigma 54-interacting transcriptional regulator [Hydrogenophilus thiooxidans]|uniref:sigma 54-interacting transcriptional regulator n=1 Tax=Hydrogenophilus thiooxidans TaxID=2820326 RepID=UPI001C218E04|nr:sigma 54-interacting transcriptional regulator [Hydrogenophilus thiooxidans]
MTQPSASTAPNAATSASRLRPLAHEIWIVDDDDAIRWVLDKALARAGLPHRTFANPKAALAAAETAPPLVLVTDVRMPEYDGYALVTALKTQHPELVALLMTAYSDLDAAVHAFQVGAFEYLPKPFDVNDAVALITRAWQTAQQRLAPFDPAPPAPHTHPTAAPTRDATAPAKEPPSVAAPSELIGASPAMQTLYRAIGRLSTSHATVLIIGETGTGKELVARALHRHSPRANGPFVAINTAAIPRDLLEAELFGVEKGAYTGATTARPGRFEEAHGGTLFLDEIGDMPLELQTRLLRVLALGEFHRLGGRELKKVNVRIIAATHQNLAAKVAEGTFREDLYHRLNVIRLTLPPLRDRQEDIPLLAEHFLRRAAHQLGVEPKRLTAEALACLARYPFPGNVRELENLCHWLTVMAPAATVTPEDLPETFRPSPPQPAPYPTLHSTPHPFPPEPPARHPATATATPLKAPLETAHQPLLETPHQPTPHPAPPPDAHYPSSSREPAAPPTLANASAHPTPPDWQAALAATLPSPHPTAPNWQTLLAETVRTLLAQAETTPPDTPLYTQLREAFDACILATALAHTQGHKQRAAQLLGVSRNVFARKRKDSN